MFPDSLHGCVFEMIVMVKYFCFTLNLQAIIAQQDSQIELHRTFQLKSKPARPHSNVLFEQEKQRNLEKQKEELANLHKLQAQHREEQQRWEKERDRQSIQIERLEAQLKEREEECRKWEEKLNEEKAELGRQHETYQQNLERLRESTRLVAKEGERVSQEKERLEQQQEKIKKYMSHISQAQANYDDPTHVRKELRYLSVLFPLLLCFYFRFLHLFPSQIII